MIRLLTACLFMALGAAPALSETESKTLQVISAEQNALGSVTEIHLGRLMGLAPQAPKDLYDAAWIDAQPDQTGGANWQCLTQALYFEARGETIRGQFAVAEVILNRVDSSRFPTTVCRVVNQGTGRRFACQFTYTCDGLPEHVSEQAAWDRAGKIAAIMLAGGPRVLTNGATYYHTTAVRPGWASAFRKTARIGDHLFYRDYTAETELAAAQG